VYSASDFAGTAQTPVGMADAADLLAGAVRMLQRQQNQQAQS
jgi:hypothetical protein